MSFLKTNTGATLLAWLAVAAHLAVGILAWRRATEVPLVPLLNLVAAGCVVAYWAQRWYGYIVKGITWHATDQLVPLYAILVCIISGLTLAGRYNASLPHWLIFGVDTAVLLAAALFFTFFRMNRLI